LKNKKSLAETHPEVAKQWHPTKNGNLTPFEFSKGSHQKIWWKCDVAKDHIWESPIYSRTNGHNCPYCAGQKVASSNSIVNTHPHIIDMWHWKKNNNIDPLNFSKGSEKKVWWKCDKGEDHEWEAKIKHISAGSKCPICSGQKVVNSNCLATIYPEIAKEWHPTKNGNLTPYDFTAKSSGKKVWWKCDKGNDHEWESNIGNRTVLNQGCPVCTGQKVVLSNCLATTHPEIAKQWHPTKNGKLTPYMISSGTHKSVWWKCDKGVDHEWKNGIGNRTNQDNGCPFCTLTPQSKQELTITFELMKLFKDINPKGLKTKLDGKLRAIDIYIPKLNLCVEFDGSYWHKDRRDLDKIKSEMLFDKGYKLIRVRQEPLKKIYDTDVISKKQYNGKQVTNDLLTMILNMFELDAELVSKIKAYQSKKVLQNEKGLEKYIDKILTEKASKS